MNFSATIAKASGVDMKKESQNSPADADDARRASENEFELIF
jgi:hypothetical protein